MPLSPEPRDAAPDVELAQLPRERLLAMQAAADEMVAVLDQAANQGGHILLDVINSGVQPFSEWNHYPAGDVQDAEAGALWYYHAHGTTERARPWPEHGHFHLFLYSEHVPAGAVPLALPVDADRHTGGLCHLAAISFADNGLPARVFTTNRWVTNEWLYPAETIIPLLGGFAMKSDRFSLTTRWLVAALELFRPQIEQSLFERDRILDGLSRRDPEQFAEDRQSEVLSSFDFDLAGQMDAIEEALALTRP